MPSVWDFAHKNKHLLKDGKYNYGMIFFKPSLGKRLSLKSVGTKNRTRLEVVKQAKSSTCSLRSKCKHKTGLDMDKTSQKTNALPICISWNYTRHILVMLVSGNEREKEDINLVNQSLDSSSPSPMFRIEF